MNGSSNQNYIYCGGPKTQVNYVRCDGPKPSKTSFNHNESQNTISIDVSRPCEKRKYNKLNFATNTNDNQGLIPADPCINKLLAKTNTQISIEYQYLKIFQCPPTHMWSKVNRKIRRNLALPVSSRNMVTRVLKIIESCLRSNREINLTKDLRAMRQVNGIPLDILKAQLIADKLKNGLSFENACEEINCDSEKDNKQLFTLNAIYGIVRRLKPIQSTV